ncbi:hypothetical protein S7335_736 [Synechococcus sp. PCC 7335]|nr:hypothetical protein [Synechococcus sp. PCC 7335]EDX83556.1 hypothetical protein S7335_736 [Synechococcus sp. PCC 7335]
MANPETATTAFMHPWTAHYAKLIAIALIYSAMVHLGNIAGLTGTP